MEITKFQLKRVNPFQGLVIDADTWRDAHNYHRELQRLHTLAFHKTGIVSGLEVSPNSPPDSSVNISPGIAIDPDGNVIIVSQNQRYRLQTPRQKGTIYLIIQFREVPGEPYQPPEGGQPTRILEAYRIQERDHLPSEPYIELARIDFDPSQPTFKEAKNPSNPATNEIDLRFRESALQAAPREKVVQKASAPPMPAVQASAPAPKETILLGHMVLGEANKSLHVNGLRNLIKEVNRQEAFTTAVEDLVDLKKSLNRYNLLYLTGNGRFELSTEQQSALSSYLKTGGVIFGDGCSITSAGTDVRGAREFGLSFNRCASQLNCKLEMVKRGNPLLTADYIFAEVPQGCEPPMLLEGGNMICSSSDYGCAWEGGHIDQPLSREIIRSALEIGGNMIAYARKVKNDK